jgi:ABC-type multidrug transport system fused ATPase/permease subunit
MITLFNRLKFHILGFFAGLLLFLIAATMSNLYGEAGVLVFILYVVITVLSLAMIKNFMRNSTRSINEIIETAMNEKKHEHNPEELMLAVSCALGMAAAMYVVRLVMR